MTTAATIVATPLTCRRPSESRSSLFGSARSLGPGFGSIGSESSGALTRWTIRLVVKEPRPGSGFWPPCLVPRSQDTPSHTTCQPYGWCSCHFSQFATRCPIHAPDTPQAVEDKIFHRSHSGRPQARGQVDGRRSRLIATVRHRGPRPVGFEPGVPAAILMDVCHVGVSA